MPLIRIYVCVTCFTAVRTPFDAEPPLHCGLPAKWKQTRDFHPENHGWATGEKSAAIGFRHTNPWEVPIQNPDGSPVRVESLRDIRKIESESAKMAADGEGQEMRFRAFNNDLGNGGHGAGRYENSFGAPPQRAPQLFDKQGRQRISLELVEGETMEAADMGPGADEALASALGPGMSLEP